ncbi:two-component system sensor histidine kinase NtrB [Thiovibrio sp. JS02]
MSQGLPLLPIYIVDVCGSGLMIVMALFAVFYARRLTRLEPGSVLWAYLFWLCMAMVAFAVSRSIGHILRFGLLAGGFPDLWHTISPYSGGFNSLTFVAVAVLTFYFYNVYGVLELVRDDARKLAAAHAELAEAHAKMQELNQTLEERVEERTRDLALSELKFRRLYESSKDMIFFCDANQRISDINDSGLEMLGYAERAKVVGQPLALFFQDEEKWSRYFCQLNSTGHVKDFEVEFLKQDGAPLYLLVTATAICGGGQGLEGCEVIAKDMTHFREVTEQLIRSENLASLGQLAAGVAHEINTPLGIILGYTQLLKEDFEEQAEVLESLQIVEKQTKVCKRIVTDLLKFSRHTLEGVKEAADINQCLAEAVTMVEHALKMDHIRIERHFSDDLPQVVVDRERLRQVLVNMFTNAQHAIGREGVVGLWTRHNEHCATVEITIADSGSGIPPAAVGRIFDPFFTTKGVGKGTGLGLSVSFGIIKDHGGQIDVFSPPREPELLEAGMRTAFRITLPLEGGSAG